MEAKDLFSAESKSVLSLFNGNGEFFYIPAYQRQYTWPKAGVEKLLEGIASGLQNLLSDADGFTFLGTAITIVDTNHETVQPHFHGQLPAKVHLVIDGQQRLTTLSLLLIALHSRLRLSFEQLKKVPFEDLTPFEAAFSQKLGEVLQAIKDSLISDEFAGYKRTAPYVRIIRAYDDAWSKQDDQRRYESPIASMINGYGIVCDGFNLDSKLQKFTPKSFAEKDKQTCLRRFKDIQSMLELLVAKGIGEEGNETVIPSGEELLNSTFVSDAFSFPNYPEIRASFEDATDDQAKAIRLLTFALYTLNRVALTVVQVKKDEYAFEVFDSLNTTGQALAPFETFIPLVMKAVTLSKYQSSDEFKIVENAKSLIGDLDLSPNQDIALNAGISFALIECGTKIGKKIEVQRNLYRSTFARVSADQDQRMDYLQHLVSAIDFHARTLNHSKWKQPAFENQLINSLSEETKVCLSFLSNLKHTIVIPLLVRFWVQYELSIGKEAEGFFRDEFERIVKACTAFTVLRRATTGGVEGIDAIYRDIMSGNNSPTSLAALQRSKQKWDGADTDVCDLSSKTLIADMSRRLTDSVMGSAITNRKKFIEKATNIPIYDESQPVARFLLLIAQHNTVPDPDRQGLVKAGANGIFNGFTLAHWIKETGNSVEHVVPQTRPQNGNDDWEDSAYEHPSTVHTLGNLTLCPQPVNSAVGNRSWTEKRVIYKAAASTTIDAAKKTLRDGGITVTNEDEFYPVVAYIPYLDAIGNMEDQVWDKEYIESRSEDLLGLAWDRLAPWLGITV